MTNPGTQHRAHQPARRPIGSKLWPALRRLTTLARLIHIFKDLVG